MAIAMGQAADRAHATSCKGKKEMPTRNTCASNPGKCKPPRFCQYLQHDFRPKHGYLAIQRYEQVCRRSTGQIWYLPEHGSQSLHDEQICQLLSSADQRAVVPIMSQLISQEVDDTYGSNLTYEQKVRCVTQMAGNKGKEFVEEVLQFNKISPDHTVTSKGSVVQHQNHMTLNSGLK